MRIKCEWMERNRLLINPDGQVLPCCYLANPSYTKSITKSDKIYQGYVMDQYDSDKEKYNIHNNDMKDIIKGKWFTKTLPESWEDETKTLHQCKQFCGVKE